MKFQIVQTNQTKGSFVQDGRILAEFSFCDFMDRDEVEVHKNAKRGRGQHPAILTELAWSIKDLLLSLCRALWRILRAKMENLAG